MRGACVIIFLLCVVFLLYDVNSQPHDGNSRNVRLSATRVKRQQQQQPEDIAEQFFDRVFGIPINTLNSVNDLVKSTIPMFRRARDRIQQQYQSWQQNGGGSGSANERPPRANGARPRPSLRSED